MKELSLQSLLLSLSSAKAHQALLRTREAGTQVRDQDKHGPRGLQLTLSLQSKNITNRSKSSWKQKQPSLSHLCPSNLLSSAVTNSQPDWFGGRGVFLTPDLPQVLEQSLTSLVMTSGCTWGKLPPATSYLCGVSPNPRTASLIWLLISVWGVTGAAIFSAETTGSEGLEGHVQGNHPVTVRSGHQTIY